VPVATALCGPGTVIDYAGHDAARRDPPDIDMLNSRETFGVDERLRITVVGDLGRFSKDAHVESERLIGTSSEQNVTRTRRRARR